MSLPSCHQGLLVQEHVVLRGSDSSGLSLPGCGAFVARCEFNPRVLLPSAGIVYFFVGFGRTSKAYLQHVLLLRAVCGFLES